MRMSRRAPAAVVAALFGTMVLLGIPITALGADDAAQAEYTVVAESGASAADVERAIRAAGGTVTGRNTAIGTFRAKGPATGFIEAVSASSAVVGAVGQRPIGKIPDAAIAKPSDAEVEQIHEGNPGGPRHGGSTAESDPLDAMAWGL